MIEQNNQIPAIQVVGPIQNETLIKLKISKKDLKKTMDISHWELNQGDEYIMNRIKKNKLLFGKTIQSKTVNEFFKNQDSQGSKFLQKKSGATLSGATLDSDTITTKIHNTSYLFTHPLQLNNLIPRELELVKSITDLKNQLVKTRVKLIIKILKKKENASLSKTFSFYPLKDKRKRGRVTYRPFLNKNKTKLYPSFLYTSFLKSKLKINQTYYTKQNFKIWKNLKFCLPKILNSKVLKGNKENNLITKLAQTLLKGNKENNSITKLAQTLSSKKVTLFHNQLKKYNSHLLKYMTLNRKSLLGFEEENRSLHRSRHNTQNSKQIKKEVEIDVKGNWNIINRVPKKILQRVKLRHSPTWTKNFKTILKQYLK